MSFSINTNIASLQAQNYLQKSSQFQAQTINKVTSGLRIVNSGDDAAGLAVANGLRSDEAVLNAGIQNANNGLATLQTVDSGMNNISTLLDRARTLAAQSASGTFTGNRSTLDSEFQTVITEISRQSQSIGMNKGGQFATSLSVFIGGGQGATSAAASTNGSIGLNLSNASVDAQSLGLTGMQASGVAGSDIGSSSATSVANILANTSNTRLVAGNATFFISGQGFSGGNRVAVNVNLSGVVDSNSLVTAVNSAIQAAGGGSTQYATAFKNANITASVVTDSQGRQQLALASSNTAFQVQAGDTTANALLGNFSQNATLTGSAQTGGAVSLAASPALSITFDGDSAATSISLSQSDTNLSQVANDLNTNTTFNARATASVVGNQLVLQSNNNSSASKLVVADGGAGSASRVLGFTSSATAATAVAASATNGSSVSTTLTGANTVATLSSGLNDTDTIKLRFQGAGLASPVDVSLTQLTTGTTTAQLLANLSSAVTNNSSLAAAGITLTQGAAGSPLQFTSTSGQNFTVSASGDTQNVLGLGSFLTNTNQNFDYSTLTASAAYSTATAANGSAVLGVSIGGAAQTTLTAQMTSNAKQIGTANVSGGPGTYTPGATNAQKLAISINGAADVIATIAPGATASATLTAINTALAGTGSASIDANNHLVISSYTQGSAGSVQIDGANSDANLLTSLGLTSGTVTGTQTDATAGSVTGSVNLATTPVGAGAAGNLVLSVDTGTNASTFTVAITASETTGAVLAGINTALGSAGSASLNASGNLVIKSALTGVNSNVTVGASSTAATLTALGLTAGAGTAGTNATLGNVVSQINNQIAQSSTLTQAGLSASNSSGSLNIASSNGTTFRLNETGSGNTGFGNAGAAFTGNFTSLAPSSSLTPFTTSQGSVGTSNFGFNALSYGNDNQTLTLSANVNGTTQQSSISLNNTNARSIDEAINTINTKLQQTNNPALQSIIAVKQDLGSGKEGVSFISNLQNFNVSIGQTNSGNGLNVPATKTTPVTQGTTVSAALQGTGGSASIATISGAQAAVNLLATAVQNLGTAQALVGKGENLLNYAISLATSKTTNEAAAESQIRDANLAQEAANLSRAQILVQAGTAALAQANSAPQQLLSLLQR